MGGRGWIGTEHTPHDGPHAGYQLYDLVLDAAVAFLAEAALVCRGGEADWDALVLFMSFGTVLCGVCTPIPPGGSLVETGLQRGVAWAWTYRARGSGLRRGCRWR